MYTYHRKRKITKNGPKRGLKINSISLCPNWAETAPGAPGPPKTTPERLPAAGPLSTLTIGGLPRKNPWPASEAASRAPNLQNSLLSDRGPPTSPDPSEIDPCMVGRRRPGPRGGPGRGDPPPLGAPDPPCMVDRRPYTRDFWVFGPAQGGP